MWSEVSLFPGLATSRPTAFPLPLLSLAGRAVLRRPACHQARHHRGADHHSKQQIHRLRDGERSQRNDRPAPGAQHRVPGYSGLWRGGHLPRIQAHSQARCAAAALAGCRPWLLCAAPLCCADCLLLAAAAALPGHGCLSSSALLVVVPLMLAGGFLASPNTMTLETLAQHQQNGVSENAMVVNAALTAQVVGYLRLQASNTAGAQQPGTNHTCIYRPAHACRGRPHASC